MGFPVVVWIAAVGCGERALLADEGRALDHAAGPGSAWSWRATLRGWHHGAGWDEDGPHLPADAVYVGWELDGDASASLRGEVDQVWMAPSLDAGRARYAGLAIERCADAAHLAFRVTGGDEPRFRVIVPDDAGAVVATTPVEDCALALLWTGSSAEWRRDRSAGVRICEHLYRLRLRDEAVRCELREPLRNATGRASRQDLPTAPDDPRFDRDLLAALGPDAPGDRSGYAPYRVRQLLAEVADRARVTALADGLARRPERSAWRAAVLAEAGAHQALADWVDAALPPITDDQLAIVAIGVATLPPADLRAAADRIRAVLPRSRCGPPHQVEPGRCPDPAAALALLH